MNWRILSIKIFLIGLLSGMMIHTHLFGQQILLDNPINAGELTLFQDLTQENQFYYLPDKARLAKDENGNPRFSFLRYVENQRLNQVSLREGEGGGILHAVVQIKVAQEQIDQAKRILQRTHPGAEILGPIMYRSGKFSLISSFTNTDGEFSESILGIGNAPILDGNTASVSIQLTKLGAKILWESFQTETPDISFSFEMDLAGYRAPHRAIIEADFEQIYDHKDFAAASASTFFSGEIKQTYDDLYRIGAIKLTQIGDDENQDAMITTAYNKLSEMMFEPVNMVKNSPGLLDQATKMLSNNREEAIEYNREVREDNLELFASIEPGPIAIAQPKQNPDPSASIQNEDETSCSNPLSSQSPNHLYSLDLASLGIEPRSEAKLPEYAFIASYQMKTVRQTGKFNIDLNKYTADNIAIRFDENIGSLNQYLDDERVFRQVNLDDPLFRQREIVAFIDGINASDFGQYINYVDVILKKQHESGEISQEETRIDRHNFSRQGNLFKMTYGWKGDNNRGKWMIYDYKMVWNFFGGTKMEYPYQSNNTASINLAPPFQRKIISLEADQDLLKHKKVRAITVKFFYQIGEMEKQKMVSIRPSINYQPKQVEIITPAGQGNYEYEIIWRMAGNKTLSSGRQTTNETLLFVDEI